MGASWADRDWCSSWESKSALYYVCPWPEVASVISVICILEALYTQCSCASQCLAGSLPVNDTALALDFGTQHMG